MNKFCSCRSKRRRNEEGLSLGQRIQLHQSTQVNGDCGVIGHRGGSGRRPLLSLRLLLSTSGGSSIGPGGSGGSWGQQHLRPVQLAGVVALPGGADGEELVAVQQVVRQLPGQRTVKLGRVARVHRTVKTATFLLVVIIPKVIGVAAALVGSEAAAAVVLDEAGQRAKELPPLGLDPSGRLP